MVTLQEQGIRKSPAQDFPAGQEFEGLRIPRHKLSGYDVPLTERRMRSVLRWLKLSMPEYLAWSGNQTLAQFIDSNPTWCARAWEVLLLGELARIKTSA